MGKWKRDPRRFAGTVFFHTRLGVGSRTHARMHARVHASAHTNCAEQCTKHRFSAILGATYLWPLPPLPVPAGQSQKGGKGPAPYGWYQFLWPSSYAACGSVCGLQARGKLGEAQRENAILKKAVQIQNSKLNERANQEQEIQQMRQMLAQYQEQVRMQSCSCQLDISLLVPPFGSILWLSAGHTSW